MYNQLYKCAAYFFLLHSTFFKGKVKSGIFSGFYVFLRGIKKTRVFFGWVQLHQHWR